MQEENKITFTVNNVPHKKNTTVDGMVALKKIEHFSYALTDEIGLGYSSHVYKGKNDKTNEIVAIKVIDIKKEDDLHRQFTNSEVNILEKIKNLSPEHLLKLEGVFKTKNNLYIITEFCEGKDLAKILRKRKTFSEEESQGIMKQFLKGYAELYTLKVVHRDLKLANIFVRKGKAILADFGFAIEYERCGEKFDYNVGSPFYMPPESLKFNRYSFKSDVWAIGVIAFELIYGHRPWKEKDDDILYEKIMTTSIDELFEPGVRVSESYKQFIRDCLQIDFDRRATPEYVINFPWNLALDYVDGLDENPHPRTISLPKVHPNAHPISTKNVSYKPIHFEEMRENHILRNNNLNELPVSLMVREHSPSKDKTDYHKKNVSLPETQKIHQENPLSNYQYESLQNKRNKRQNTSDNIAPEPYSESDIEKALLSQVQYCRFISMVFEEIKNAGLLEQFREICLQIGKKIIEKIDYLTKIIGREENEPICGILRYLSSSRGKMMEQMIVDYKEKYRQQFFGYQMREVQVLNMESLCRLITFLKQNIKSYERLTELSVFLYQLLMIEGQWDWIKFSKESRIDFLAENKNLQPSSLQTQRLMQRIENLNL